VGRALTSDLFEKFPSISRFDVYVAIGLVLAAFEADIVIASAELAHLKRAERGNG
jgi:hypothetical protein